MTNSPSFSKKVIRKPVKKVIKKPKYRYYSIGTHGQPGRMTGTIIHNKDDDTYYLYKFDKIIKQLSLEEIIKYSYSDGYTQHYKLFDNKDQKPLQLIDNKFVEINLKKL